MRPSAAFLPGFAVLATACGSESSPPAGAAPDAGPVECAAWDVVRDDGSCKPPGIPADSCPPGFLVDERGACNAILPAEACGPGRMAVPGDAACRDVAACGPAPYGDAPVDAGAQHVDASYGGSDSDGTATRPWTTILAAIGAAEQGSVIAIAAGSYVGDVDIAKRVLLWGRCPGLVEIVGDDPAFTAVAIRADEVELHAVAIRGEGYGVVMSGAENVLLDRLWIHDTANRGLQIYDGEGAASVRIADSLVERTERTGMIVSGSQATLERTVVRDVQGTTDPESGWGITTTDGEAGRSTLALAHVVLERNHGIGVSVWASDATIEASVVRDTLPLETGELGRGISVSEGESGARANVVVRGCLIERNHEVGVAVEGSDLTIETTTVRDTAPKEGLPLPLDVRGVVVQHGGFTGSPGALTIRESLLDRNLGNALFVGVSTADVESVLARDTQPQPPDQHGGMGFYLRDQAFATIRSSVVQGSRVAGIAIVGSEATIERCSVQGTLADAASGLFGDGIDVLSHQSSIAKATVTETSVVGSQRAGIGNFAGIVLLDASTLECNAIDLDGEPDGSETTSGTFDFQSGATNVCRCEAETQCLVQTTDLAPPAL